MSTYYDIHCRTCDEPAGFDEVKGGLGVEQLENLLRKVEVWRKLVGIVGNGSDVELKMLSGYGIQDFPTFADKHRGHDLAIRSEYGDFLDRQDCSYQVKCPGCAQKMSCALRSGHAGEHHLIPFV